MIFPLNLGHHYTTKMEPIFVETRRSSTIASHHGDGLEERKLTQRNDTFVAPRRRLGLATIVPL
jgi:hypothetical protein